MKKAFPLILLCMAVGGCNPDTGGQGDTPSSGDANVTVQTPVGAGPSVAALPLQLGYYVRSDLSCEQATGDDLYLLTSKGRGSSREFCTFQLITPDRESTLEVVEVCEDLASGGKAAPTTVKYKLLGEAAFLAKDDSGWEIEARFCPQESLPEPWRSKEIK